jgi:hypothetical protein
VLDFAPGAISKINKLFILSQLRLVEEWREKLDDDFLFSWQQLGERLHAEAKQLNLYLRDCPWCCLAK